MSPKRALFRSKGDQTATCPGDHTGCITNVNKLESLSEYESGCEIGRHIVDAGVTVAYCTKDGDSRLHKGVAHSIQKANPSHQVIVSWCFEPSQPQRITSGLSHQLKRLAELVHLSQTQVKRATHKKNKKIQPPPVSRCDNKERQECKCVLAADLKNGSSMILKHNYEEKFNADTDQMKCEMPSVISAVL